MSSDNPLGLGATGRFPRGKHRPDDQGELKSAITANPINHTVFIDFGKPVAWLALPPEDAEALAAALIQSAKKARG